jgi:phosphatidylserine/phosphatidylglycerophosphate/cardiolipin synthase-like enzyme
VSAFEAAAEAAVQTLGAQNIRTVAARIGQGWPDDAVRAAVPGPAAEELIAALLKARRADAVPDATAAAYLRGLADGHGQALAQVQVESVWSGPETFRVPVRATGQVLAELAETAKRELVLVTYSAKPYGPLLERLSAAIARGVRVSVVVETLAGAGSALAGTEPAAAFATVHGIELWHWPRGRRTEQSAKMHAKIAIADRVALLVSSANLTQSGVDKNLEAGLLVRGGSAPRRAAEHLDELKSAGILERLSIDG